MLHIHCCASVSPGAAGAPTVSVLLSDKAATWQSYSEVSREKLTEGSSLTPLVFMSSGHSVGSWVKERDRNEDGDQPNCSSHNCGGLKETDMSETDTMTLEANCV